MYLNRLSINQWEAGQRNRYSDKAAGCKSWGSNPVRGTFILYLELLPEGGECRGENLFIYLHLLPTLRKTGAMLPLPYTPSWQKEG